MASMNKVFLLGNLTRDPELRYTPGGAAVCEFGIAVNRKFTVNNQEREETCFVDIVVWGKQAETTSRYLGKGAPALIEGRLQLDQWEDKDSGSKRSRLRVVAERVQFMSRGGGAGRDEEQRESGQRDFRKSSAPAPRSDYPEAANHESNFPPVPDNAFDTESGVEDDIPF